MPPLFLICRKNLLLNPLLFLWTSPNPHLPVPIRRPRLMHHSNPPLLIPLFLNLIAAYPLCLLLLNLPHLLMSPFIFPSTNVFSLFWLYSLHFLLVLVLVSCLAKVISLLSSHRLLHISSLLQALLTPMAILKVMIPAGSEGIAKALKKANPTDSSADTPMDTPTVTMRAIPAATMMASMMGIMDTK